MRYKILLLLAMGSMAAGGAAAEEPDYSRQRALLLERIDADIRLTAAETGRDRFDREVLKVIGRLPRHEFVPAEYRRHAYENRPLPIGYGQTISQPYIVALMTDLAQPAAEHRVLEVGTGSGYQAAVLAELVARVYSIEIIPELGRQAAERLERLGFDNVETRIGDGYYGWREEAPFDAIVVTAAAGHIPPPLVEQLRPGGRMIIPVGGPFSIQQLMLVEKRSDGTVRTRQILPVAFVPLTGSR